jgi:3-hydroxyacyl-CoA dehydrogenase/enoyl-CoA hydratase/3-hydroxybutyryl-CoA epimerase
MMGAGIAYVSAKVGMEVVLLDTAQESADKGKAYSAGLLDKDIKKGKLLPTDKDSFLSRILATTKFEDLAGCDLIIEAVFEDRAIKADVTQEDRSGCGVPTSFSLPTRRRCRSPRSPPPRRGRPTSSASTSSRRSRR